MRVMRKILLFSVVLFFSFKSYEQCVANASVDNNNIVCGECVTLSAYGNTGASVFSENFNSGSPTGWAFTQSADYSNPCSTNGVDGTTHMWMGSGSVNPRSAETNPYNLTPGGTICFDMLYAQQGGSSPCEGPDLPSEGVYLQYSTDGGVTWNTIAYHDPLGGNDPNLTTWNNYCYPIPAGAMTTGVQIRWYQDTVSGAGFDHWGIDNVEINLNDPLLNVSWLHDGYTYGAGNTGGVHPNQECLKNDSSFIVMVTNGTSTCYDTVDVKVKVPTINLSLTPQDTLLCGNQCVPINANSIVYVDSAKIKRYENKQPESINSTGGGLSNVFSSVTVDLNVQGLNMPTVNLNSIQQVCITGLSLYRSTFVGTLDISKATVELICPSGGSIILVDRNVTTGGGGLGYNNGYLNTCFEPVGPNISSGTVPYTDTFQTQDPFNNLAGCTSNGIWSLRISEVYVPLNMVGDLEGFSITFQDDSITYPAIATWNHGTWLSDSTILNPTACPTVDTSYILTVSDSNQCVSLIDTVNIAFWPVPDAGRDSIYSSCATAPVDLFNYLGGTPQTGGTWLDPNNTPVTMPITPGIPTPTGLYMYTLTNGFGCSDTAYVDFQTREQIVTLRNDTGICTGETIVLTANVPNSNYLWNTGAIVNSITVSPGTYWVDATDTTFGCIRTDTVHITPLPVPFAGRDSAYASCDSSQVDLYSYLGGAPLNTGTWYNPSNAVVTMPITPFVDANGNYTYVLTNVSGCSDTAVVSFNALQDGPANLLGNDTSICAGTSLTLSVTAAANSRYLWSTGATTTSITVSSSASYWVNVIDTVLGCTFVDTITVTVVPLPDAGIDGSYLTCDVTPVDLSNYLGGSPVAGGTWLDPSNNTVTMPITPLAVANGNYSYVVVNSTGCRDTAQVNFTAIPVPVGALLGEDTTHCFENGQLQIDATVYPAVNSYLWNNGATTSGIIVSDGGLYWVEVSTTNCGNYRDSIIVSTCAPVVEMPNVFTPNGDAENEKFIPVKMSGVVSASMVIFNRWGTKVFTTTNLNFGWDGKTDGGKECSDGVYYWIIEYKDLADEKYEVKGNVTLTR